MDLPESVKAAAAKSFGVERLAELAMMLPAREHLPLSPPFERVLLAIVGLADGDLDEIAEYSKAAMIDWRDVLYWWETPELAGTVSDHEQIPNLKEPDE